jgi:dimethylargininase
MDTPGGTLAIVRDLPDTFDRAIQPSAAAPSIDVELAREQHRLYCRALEHAGLSLIRLAADDRFPDCCYVEDTAIVVGEKAVIAAPGAASRRGETVAVEAALRDYKQLHRIEAPATLDGGDVLSIDKRIYVGLSGRTNEGSVEQLEAILSRGTYEIIPVEVHDILHLKSACTHLGGDVITWLSGHLDDHAFARYTKIVVPAEEAHAANCLSVNGVVLVPAGAPSTRAKIEEAGFETIELDISESRKAGGGLTCSSIIL